MITQQDYFKKLKFIKTSALPEKLRHGYVFVEKITEGHKHWKYYTADKNIKEKVDQYLLNLNKFLTGGTKAPVTKDQAREVAKELIRSYVLRGDSLESLASSHLGQYGSESGAQIRNGKIEVERVKGYKVEFVFSLAQIYTEIKQEWGSKNETRKISHAKTLPKKLSSKKGTSDKTRQDSDQNPKISIDYSEAKPVEFIQEEIKFIKRFLSLNNKNKTKQQILSFVNALKRAILEKRIRKTSKYAKEIMQIQTALVAKHKMMKNEEKIKLSPNGVKHLADIVGSVRVRLSIQYLKRFIGIQGKNITKEKAQNLHDLVLKAIESKKVSMSDPYLSRIKKTLTALKQFIKVAGKNQSVEVNEEALEGLNGVLGCLCDEEEKEMQGLDGIETKNDQNAVMSVEEARQKEFQTVNITGKWLELIGKFCLPTQFFVYGLGGNGKSSFVLLFTQYLASLGYKILYVAGEQFNTPTFTNLLNRLNIHAGDNYKIVGKIDTLNPADFDFVVLDSKDKLKLDVDLFTDYMRTYPNQSFIILSQSTKNGSFTGKERWRNTVDVMIEAENGVIRTGHDKNRWGGAGEMHIFDHPSQYKKAG